jgi:threonine/homoserine/homoserine lactone efflux protein
MPDTHTLLAFVAACAAIILSPGPAQALVLARTLSDGRSAGVMTAVGLNVGVLVHSVTAALGLTALLATSAVAFAVVKFAGAGYLVYLGVRALRSGSPGEAAATPARMSSGRAFRHAVVTGTLNPKVAIFFLAFLPQFVDPGRGSAFTQFLVFGCILAALDIAYESTLALLAGGLQSRLTGSSQLAAWRQKATGAVLVGLGLRLAFVSRR